MKNVRIGLLLLSILLLLGLTLVACDKGGVANETTAGETTAADTTVEPETTLEPETTAEPETTEPETAVGTGPVPEFIETVPDEE